MTLSAGVRLGPYEILDLVGAGGMGEVYRARDPRLGRDVAVKVLPVEVGADAARLRRFEQEARAVATLSHPNILTVFDVGTQATDGAAAIPYVVTELLQGETLREMATRRALTARQVLGFAVQAARGLGAAHEKGIVHRDVKPENLFVTTDGRVKLLDFGLAKAAATGAESEAETEAPATSAGQIVGTVGYMSPEQVRGLPLDARTDVFSLGVVLYELLGGKHPFRKDAAIATLTAILDDEPTELASLERGVPPAVSGVVKRCLAKDRSERFGSARDLGFALEAVLQGRSGPVSLEGAEERSPYPGLSSFTEKDAARFFGREAEARALWQRLANRRLLAVIGPSGTGKTSFVRAGVIASAPEGWRCLRVTPGNRPFPALVRALVAELAGDPDALQVLVGAETNDELLAAIVHWRRQHGEALLVLDQFEELFTLAPAETQGRLSALLGRLAAEADVHVLVSLRDDFLMRAVEQPPLRPILSELTALLPLEAASLRRALVEPAKARGYAFDDEALVEDMVSSVQGARAALPLLAFAVSRLWEKRDREKRLLTREAYEEIGGVAGALAQHAEATMDRIGAERQGMVRELFRNLVTAQGTRAVAEREELLSVVPQRGDAEEVLRELIDARLLTSYEVEAERSTPQRDGGEGAAASHRVEVAHESLIKAWPRLVRWQAQDEEGAVLRDQLKQAAHLWEEKGRSEDLLWTGTAFEEFALWRKRYPGALTALEEEFAAAMAAKARRHRTRRRLALGAVVAAALAVAVVTGTLWRRSEAARDVARTETLRAEAGKLLALGRTHLEDDRTAALAYTRASLDLHDTPEARRFVLDVLWRGPVARILPVEASITALGLTPEPQVFTRALVLSPDGRWLAVVRGRQIVVFDRDGGPPRALPSPSEATVNVCAFGPRSDLLVTGGDGHTLRFWSLPELRERRTVDLGGLRAWWGAVRGESLFLLTAPGSQSATWPGLYTVPAGGGGRILALDLPDGSLRAVADVPPREGAFSLDPTGTRTAFLRDGAIGIRRLDAPREKPLQWTAGLYGDVAFAPKGDLAAVVLPDSGEIRIARLRHGPGAPPLRVLRGPRSASLATFTIFDPEGGHLTQEAGGAFLLWPLDPFPDTSPLRLGRPGLGTWRVGAFDPAGRWLVTADAGAPAIELWPIETPFRRELPGASGPAFTGDSRWLATCPMNEPPRAWPVHPADGRARDLLPGEACSTLATSPIGNDVLVGTMDGRTFLSSAGGPPRLLPGRWNGIQVSWTAFDRQGRRAFASPGGYEGTLADPADRVLRLWDLPSGRPQVHSVAHLVGPNWMALGGQFAPDGRFYAGGLEGLRRLTFPEDPGGARVASETLLEASVNSHLGQDGRSLLVVSGFDHLGAGGGRELRLLDLASGTSRSISTHGDRILPVHVSPSGRAIVTGSADGLVRVGPATGEEPHLLVGHEGTVTGLAVSPDERWVASAAGGVVHVWPMPDVTKPPLHTLPRAELLAMLDALTNLRAVRDASSSTGWKLDVGPFPGWRDLPEW